MRNQAQSEKMKNNGKNHYPPINRSGKLSSLLLTILLISSIFIVLINFASFSGATGLTFAGVNGTQPSYNIPITLTNNQANATSPNLQVKVSINSSANAAYYNSTLLNVNWQDGSGNILNSWLESGETKTSASSVYWVNLGARNISSNGNLTIYQCIYPTSVIAMDGNHTGAEPKYTETYGQYDNGPSVFQTYWNFNGTTKPSAMVNLQHTSGGAYVQNNGFNFSAYDNPSTKYDEYWYLTPSFNPANTIAESFAFSNKLNSGYACPLMTRNLPISDDTWTGIIGNQGAANYYVQCNTGTTLIGAGSTNSCQINTLWKSGTTQKAQINYGTVVTCNVGVTPTQYLAFKVWSGGTNPTNAPPLWYYYVYIQWARTRILPPNEVMPTVTTGAVTPTSILLSTTNGQSSVNSPTTSTLYSYWTPQGADSLTDAYYLFSINSGSGYINQTWTPFNGQNWANQSLPLSNYTPGTTIQWIVYANDSAGQQFSSSVQSFVVQANVTFYFTEGGALWLNGVSIANGTTTTFNSNASSTIAAIVSSGNCFSSFMWSYPANASSTSNPLAFTPAGDCAFWAYMNQTWIGGYTQGWTIGNATGYTEGWNTGNATGYNNGYTQGWNEGNVTGYIYGFNVGNTTGFNNGYLSGWKNCASAVAGENRSYVAVAIVGQGNVNYTYASAGYYNGQPITVPETTGEVSTPTVITSNNPQTVLQLTANPANGYVFDHWVFDDGATCANASIYVSVNQCQLAVAVFTQTG